MHLVTLMLYPCFPRHFLTLKAMFLLLGLRFRNPLLRVLRLYIAPIVVMVTVFSIPRFFEYKQTFFDPKNETTPLSHLSPTPMMLTDAYRMWYLNWASLLVRGLIPLVLLLYTNIRIYQTLRHRRRNPPDSSRTQSSFQDDRKLAVVLFSVVIVYAITNVPWLIIDIIDAFGYSKMRKDMAKGCPSAGSPIWVKTIGPFILLLRSINTSANFFCYAFFSEDFRVNLKWRFSRDRQSEKRKCQCNSHIRVGTTADAKSSVATQFPRLCDDQLMIVHSDTRS